MTLLSWLGTLAVCSLWLGLVCLCLCLYFREDVFPLFIGSNIVHVHERESVCSEEVVAGVEVLGDFGLPMVVADGNAIGESQSAERMKSD